MKMLSGNVAIEAVAYELAPEVITSAAIEAQLERTMERLGIRQGLLEELTGIRERRFWEPGVMPSDVATRAALKVIEQAGIDKAAVRALARAMASARRCSWSVATTSARAAPCTAWSAP